MQTDIEDSNFANSVIAVPPLARDASAQLSVEVNRRLVERLHAGGVSTFLYGGNANVYHLSQGEYAKLLDVMADICPQGGWMIPSAGPDYGKLRDQAALIERASFRMVMMLPSAMPATAAGAEHTVRDFVQRIGRGVMLYVKNELLSPEAIGRLYYDGTVVAVKYAIPREDPAVDPYLEELTAVMPSSRIVSGFGEMPAIVHMRQWKLAGYTAGSVCLAPRLSTAMLKACRRGDWAAAAGIRDMFVPLEQLRDRIDPISVLHYAMAQAGLEDMGEILPALSEPPKALLAQIGEAARTLQGLDLEALDIALHAA